MPNHKSGISYIEGIRTELLAADSLSVRVQAEENALVNQGVLVLRPGALLMLGVRGADNRLDFVAVDETSNVGVGDLGGGKAIIEKLSTQVAGKYSTTYR